MIASFACKETERLYRQLKPMRALPAHLQQVARRKLRIINAVERLQDLAVPPGNRLEKLSGKLAGQYSIRINDQYRVCFTWLDGDAYDVMIVDYHK